MEKVHNSFFKKIKIKFIVFSENSESNLGYKVDDSKILTTNIISLKNGELQH